MSLIRALATKRCFPEHLQDVVFAEVDKSLNKEKKNVPDRLALLSIKAVMMQKILEDRTIKLLFDLINETKITKYQDIVEFSQWETEPSDMPNMPKSFKRAFQFVFRRPIPIFDGLTLKNDPEYMAVVMDHCLQNWNREFQVTIRAKNFSVEVRGLRRMFTVVEAKYAHGQKYSTHWPFIFTRIAFLRGMYRIKVVLEADKKRSQEEMEEAMSSFLKKFKKGPMEEDSPQQKESRRYTMTTSFLEERILEAVFNPIYRGWNDLSWMDRGDHWGFVE